MNYLRSQQPSSPINIPNGASSHPLSTTGSAQAPGMSGGGGGGGSISGASQQQGQAGNAEQWARHSPIAPTAQAQGGAVGAGATRPTEPIVRPVQQILTSPVDKWGLKALLYEITTQMGKTDRGMLMFGEELAELGLDVAPEE
jgi:CCR4-NOT transcription complex subunit 2